MYGSCDSEAASAATEETPFFTGSKTKKYLWLIATITAFTFGLVGITVVATQASLNYSHPGSSPGKNGLLGIIGGKTTEPGQYPWQVSVQIVLSRSQRALTCGGTLVDASHVVTAAHCTDGWKPRDLEVVAGAHRIKNTLESTQQRIPVAQIAVHPGWDIQTVQNDIAILTLSQPVILNKSVQPLRLPPADADPQGQKCLTTGWGRINPNTAEDPVIPEELQGVNETVISLSYCRLTFGSNNVGQNMICVHDFEGGKGPCNGDSGGPLVCWDNRGPYLAGIVSFGADPCAGGAPNVYTKVSSYLDFIEENTGSGSFNNLITIL